MSDMHQYIKDVLAAISTVESVRIEEPVTRVLIQCRRGTTYEQRREIYGAERHIIHRFDGANLDFTLVTEGDTDA